MGYYLAKKGIHGAQALGFGVGWIDSRDDKNKDSELTKTMYFTGFPE